MPLNDQCRVCGGHGKRWHTPTETGWSYRHDFDPKGLWPESSQAWRKAFVASLVSKPCPCTEVRNAA
jgi:hypothetical protein